MIDGLGNTPQPDRALLIRKGRIQTIAATEALSPSATTKVLELQGRYLMPGLVDTHAHVTIIGSEQGKEAGTQIHWQDSYRTLRTLLAFGVTAARNPAAPSEDGVALRQQLQSGEILGPLLRTAGEALVRRAPSYGPFVSTPDVHAVRRAVRRQQALGVDWIKVYSSLPPVLVEAAVEEAHALGLPVIGHLQRTTWTEGAELGLDAVTHGAPWSAQYLPDQQRHSYRGTLLHRLRWLRDVDFDGPQIQGMIRSLASHEVFWDPTLIVHYTKHFGDDPQVLEPPRLDLAPSASLALWQRYSFVADWTPDDFAEARRQWPRLLELTRRLHEGGVILTTGSDTPNPWVLPGLSLHQEIALLGEAGISALEVLRMATYNGALALGLEQERGSVEVGKRADLVVLQADPLADLKHTQSIEMVLLGGRIYRPAELLAR